MLFKLQKGKDPFFFSHYLDFHCSINMFTSLKVICAFPAVGHGVSEFLPRELGDLDLEQYISDVSTRKSIRSCCP